MNHEQVTLNPTILLAAIGKNLDDHFYGDSRDKAKQAYSALEKGSRIPFVKLDLGDSGEVLCDLSLDASQFVGKLNFSAFRKNLAMMLSGIKQRLDAEQSINVMNSQTGDIIFNIPGIVKNQESFNIMVCGLSQFGPGVATVNLMYLDPDAYAKAAQTGSTVNKSA